MQMPTDLGTIHIMGIGGIGMSAIAEVLAAKGFAVQGSDQKDSANVQRLRRLGMRVFVGHDGANVNGARFVVISTAVKDSNPELIAAREKGLPIIRRAEMLAEIMRLYRTISVTGTHGKTTTTSLIAHLLAASQKDPTVITGGIINDWGSNARLGKSPWMVVEADESDGTFIKIPTEIGIVTNIDPEHLDYFKTVENMHAQFEAFFKNIPFYGLAVTCIDHPVARDMIERLGLRRDSRRLLTYGMAEGADLRLTSVRIEGQVTVFDAELGPRVVGGSRRLKGWRMPIPGHHNALNALGAIAVATEMGIPDGAIHDAMASFSGVKRRFQPTGAWQGVQVFDDYGHHPVEIAAVLKAAHAGVKSAGKNARVFAVVEPHRFTRVRDLWDDFAGCFGDADQVIVLPLYTAGEPPIAGIGSAELAAAIAATGHPSAMSVASAAEVATIIRRDAKSGDLVMYLGAGHSTEWAHQLPGELAKGDDEADGA
jgi:UDP-N-acetylmuramate--alanine ligase